MNLLKHTAWSLALLASVSTFGDLAPRPVPQSEYEIRLSQPLTAALLQSVQFQNVQNINLGTCTGEVRTWEGGGTVITCQSRTSCFGRARPSCQIELRAPRGQGAAAFCGVTEESNSTGGGYQYGAPSSNSKNPSKPNH